MIRGVFQKRRHPRPPGVADLSRSAMKIKILACFVILLYGSALTFGAVLLQGFGMAMPGMSASSTGRSTSLWSIWPTPLFFVLSAIAPFIPKGRKRAFLLGIALALAAVPSLSIFGTKDGLFFMGMIAVAAVPVWVPLLAALADPSQQSDGAMQ